jgi:hypothetical protein
MHSFTSATNVRYSDTEKAQLLVEGLGDDVRWTLFCEVEVYHNKGYKETTGVPQSHAAQWCALFS